MLYLLLFFFCLAPNLFPFSFQAHCRSRYVPFFYFNVGFWTWFLLDNSARVNVNFFSFLSIFFKTVPYIRFWSIFCYFHRFVFEHIFRQKNKPFMFFSRLRWETAQFHSRNFLRSRAHVCVHILYSYEYSWFSSVCSFYYYYCSVVFILETTTTA